MLKKIVIILKGYPRLTETFIAQELLGLEGAGLTLGLVALRRPTDAKRHPVHDEIKAPIHYLPEYLHDDYARVARAFFKCLLRRGLARASWSFLKDLRHDWSRNRVRRFGQALVLAAELPSGTDWLHAHFIHTPASVTAYASLITGLPWSCSAHAKDIWTSQDWELQRKLASAQGVVTCTKVGYEHLRKLSPDPARVHLSYHGLDLARFPPFHDTNPERDGSDPSDPVIILSVGRAVDKKGYDTLLQALALLAPTLAFRFIHAGGGEELAKLKALSAKLGLAGKLEWHGALAQEDILALYRSADIFALACRVSADGDRDGLPNVLVEACSQSLVCVSTTVSGVPELLEDGINGLLVAPDNPGQLANALSRLIQGPALRKKLGDAANIRVRSDFDHTASIRQLAALFNDKWRP